MQAFIFDGLEIVENFIEPKRPDTDLSGTYNDYTENSPFPSVKENGTDYLLTAGKMQDYIDLYARNKEG